jgi:hypothetical protein
LDISERDHLPIHDSHQPIDDLGGTVQNEHPRQDYRGGQRAHDSRPDAAAAFCSCCPGPDLKTKPMI